VIVSATADQRLLAITASGGSADKFGVSGAVSRFNAHDETTAHVASTADVDAGPTCPSR
jgi:hypothetical protein